MQCKACGNQLPEGSNPFCPFCGEAQPEDNQPTESGQNTNQDQLGEQNAAPADSTAGATSAGAATEEPAAAPELDKFGQPVLTDAQKEEVAARVAEDKAEAASAIPTQVNAQTEGSAFAPANVEAGGGFVPAGQTVPGANPFNQPQGPEKKKLPTWGIVLIVLGVLFALLLCCIVASVSFFNSIVDDFDTGSAQTEIFDTPAFSDSGEVEEMPLYIDDSAEIEIEAPEAPAGSAAVIQQYIDANRAELDMIMQPMLSIMGDGSSADFEAADGEFIFVLTYSDAFPSEGLASTLDAILEASDAIYVELANQLGSDIGVQPMTVTVRYMQGGSVVTERSFVGR